jgi:hypothetical protein
VPQLNVLVPDDLSLEAFATPSTIEAIPYRPRQPFPPGHLDATVVVVGYDNAPAIGARFAELPDLRLVQTRNAGFEQWLPG